MIDLFYFDSIMFNPSALSLSLFPAHANALSPLSLLSVSISLFSLHTLLSIYFSACVHLPLVVPLPSTYSLLPSFPLTYSPFRPYTEETLVDLGSAGVKNLVVVPVSFVSEHIETLVSRIQCHSIPVIEFDLSFLNFNLICPM